MPDNGRPLPVRNVPPQAATGWDQAVDLDKDPAAVPDPAEVEVPAELRAEIEAMMAKYPDRHSAALPALEAAQRVHGWCSPEALEQVATVMRVTPAYLESVVTFYDMLRGQPIGPRYAYVCTGVACCMRNAKAVYDSLAAQAEEQGLENVELREFECLGACDMAPMASFDGRYVGPMLVEDAPEVVSALREEREVLPGRSLSDPGFKLPWEEDPSKEAPQPDDGLPPLPGPASSWTGGRPSGGAA